MMESVQELSSEVRRLKSIIFGLIERSKEDTLSYEEGLAFDSAMERLRRGESYTLEDIEIARKKVGLEI